MPVILSAIPLWLRSYRRIQMKGSFEIVYMKCYNSEKFRTTRTYKNSKRNKRKIKNQTEQKRQKFGLIYFNTILSRTFSFNINGCN